MDERDFRDDWQQIEAILTVYLNDFGFCPREEDVVWNEEMNPTKDPLRYRMDRLDRIVSWREKVAKSFRCQDELFKWEFTWKRRYMTPVEHEAFWTYYSFQRPWNQDVAHGIKKVGKNLRRWRLME